jgi:hypothetical protein
MMRPHPTTYSESHDVLTIPCSPPSRFSDGNPTEALYQHHGHSVRCKTPEHLTRSSIDCGTDALYP